MNFIEYQQEALKTFKGSDNFADNICYLDLGLSGELGELCNLFKKRYHNQNIREKYLDESGDCLWYLAVLGWIMLKEKSVEIISSGLTNGWNSRIVNYLSQYHNEIKIDFACSAQGLLYTNLSANNSIINILLSQHSEPDLLEIDDNFYDLAILVSQAISSASYDHNLTLEEIFKFNIAKLRARHGESYNSNFYRKEVNEGLIEEAN